MLTQGCLAMVSTLSTRQQSCDVPTRRVTNKNIPDIFRCYGPELKLLIKTPPDLCDASPSGSSFITSQCDGHRVQAHTHPHGFVSTESDCWQLLETEAAAVTPTHFQNGLCVITACPEAWRSVSREQ
jgi:hypothetical protein